MSEELKPCPMCGAKGLIGETMCDGVWFAMCEQDRCIQFDHYWQTEAEAIAAWNTRAPDLTERAAIVAWLRKQDGHGYDDMRADLIEAGEHHERG